MIWNLNNLKRYWEKNRDTSSCFNFIEKKSIKSENFWKLKDLQMKSVLNTKKKKKILLILLGGVYLKKNF